MTTCRQPARCSQPRAPAYSQGLLNLHADLVNAQQQSGDQDDHWDAAPAKGGEESEGQGGDPHKQEARRMPIVCVCVCVCEYVQYVYMSGKPAVCLLSCFKSLY